MLKTCCHKTIELGLLQNQFHSRWNCQFFLRSSERANFHLKNWNSEEGNESTILFDLFFNCKMDFERTSRRSRISSAFTSVKYYKICETFETIHYHISYFFSGAFETHILDHVMLHCDVHEMHETTLLITRRDQGPQQHVRWGPFSS